MKQHSIYDHEALRAQLEDQKKHAWNIDQDISWHLGVDTSKYLLPLDKEAIAFPGANPEQHRALSQIMGIIVNSTVSEMEHVAFKIRDVAWREILNSFPVNPEMYELGEQFFKEEEKHAALFRRYNDLFCDAQGIDPWDLAQILPNAYGAVFQKAIIANARAGGHAFWWVVAVVEEVALLIYQNLYRHRKEVDPLFFNIHKKHFEEESRHTNYAFMMLELIKSRPMSFWRRMHLKIDLGYSEIFSTGWILTELNKFRRVKNLAPKHPFFETLASCLPLLESLHKRELVRRLFVSAPYISLILNRNYHRFSKNSAADHGALAWKHPQPENLATVVRISDELLNEMDDAWQRKSNIKSSAD